MIEVTCPHCKKTFKCEFGGCSLHCYDYKEIETGRMFAAGLQENITTCVECKKDFNLQKHSKKVD